MSLSQEGRQRTRSSFAAAVLSLIFPGLGHAYAGAWNRALVFAAPPVLLIALIAGIALRIDRLELLGFLLQPEVLIALLIMNVIVLVYRLVAIVDAWRVAGYLNYVDAVRDPTRDRRRVRSTPVLGAVSIAGLLAAILVMGGAHAAVAYYDLKAQELVNCVFEDDVATCDEPSPTPSVRAPRTSRRRPRTRSSRAPAP